MGQSMTRFISSSTTISTTSSTRKLEYYYTSNNRPVSVSLIASVTTTTQQNFDYSQYYYSTYIIPQLWIFGTYKNYSRVFTVKTDGIVLLFIPQFFSYRRGTCKILWNTEWNNPQWLFQIIPQPGCYHRGAIYCGFYS